MSEWDHLHWSDVWESLREGGTATIGWGQDFEGAHLRHVFAIHTQTTMPVSKLTLTKLMNRVLCYVIVSKLPDQALPELCNTIAEMYRFYVPARSEVSRKQLTKKHVVAKEGKRYLRQDIRLDEE